MDTDLLFRDEEHFSPFDSESFLDNDSANFSSDLYDWNYDSENHDQNLMSSLPEFIDYTSLVNMSPKQDFQKMVTDWQSYINEDGENDIKNFFTESQLNPEKNFMDSFLSSSELDLDNILAETTVEVKPKQKIAMKKIDTKAHKYIVDEDIVEDEDDEIDVETVCENEVSPVIEAGDLKSLLEQFEASETSNNLLMTGHQHKVKIEVIKEDESSQMGCVKKIKQENIDQERCGTLILNGHHHESSHIIVKQEKMESIENKEIKFTFTKNNKQIIDELPQELINRIKETGKRKTISVINPVPNKKRINSRIQNLPTISMHNSKIAKSETVHLDHDYCGSPFNRYPKHPQKDSGFESAEEEDNNKSIIKNQPFVKNADGKLMVSLLKINTIRKTTEDLSKKKLNLEEYKKRREGVLSKASSSLTSSPMSSACSSPLPEDENTKRMKHMEKLRKMAAELLNTPAKSVGKCQQTKTTVVEVSKPTIEVQGVVRVPDMEVKTIVSIGVNTEIVNIKGKHPLKPVEQLEEIKPILENANVKIDKNSLISSMMESVPKIIKTSPSETKEIAHGEDRTIIYLPKNRPVPKTADRECQTRISLMGGTETPRRSYRRRRMSSSSSDSSSERSRVVLPHRRRKISSTSRTSKTSRSRSRSSLSSSSDSSSSCSRSSYSSSSSTSFRSRSRSISSPRRVKRRKVAEQEYVREVEERRVIYVGKIASNTSREELRKRFQKFGSIKSISLHFRDHGDNYGFVTFENKLDAYQAIEHGNDDLNSPQFDLSFGGRRLFCQTTYSDLDNVRDSLDYYSVPTAAPSDNTFDALLKEAQEKLRKRKKC